MTRFERYGFLRVLTAGLAAWIVIALHLVVAAIQVVAFGVAGVYGWRRIGDWLHRHRGPQ